VPCELIEDNGAKLKKIVLSIAERWNLDPQFEDWIETAVPFCNTLVDRIVPGAPNDEYAAELRDVLPYEDGMITIAEPYRLFAIEGDDTLRERLRFADADDGIIVAGSITPYRLRKVRLLNGAHTSFVSLAILAGCQTVREAVEHPVVGAFLRSALLDEIVPSVDVPGAERFARDVLARFANPYLQHQLWDITLQGTTKFRVRVVPSILDYVRATGTVPRALALGYAGFLAFQDGSLQAARRTNGLSVPADAAGEAIGTRWREVGNGPAAIAALVHDVSADVELWGTDLSAVPGFVDLVTEQLTTLREQGAIAAIEALGLAPAR
jgi:tagaturonate reductase